jgi:hypothetical protein
LGARLRTAALIVVDGKPAMYGVTRWVRAEEVVWDVELREDLTAVGRVYALCDAWESITSRNGRWSDPDEYSQGGKGWQWAGISKPFCTHHNGKPLLQDHA